MNSEAYTIQQGQDVLVNERLRRYIEGVQWVWLDLDDTLIDFKTNSEISLRLTYNNFNLEKYFPTVDEWISCYQLHNHSLWDRYNRAEISQDYLRIHRFIDPIREKKEFIAEDLITQAKVMDKAYLNHLALQKCMVDGAMQLIEHLRSHNYNIGILSNGFRDVQHRKLHTVGLDTKVDLVVLSDDIGINKPDTRLYAHAMVQSGTTDPSLHLMIGDNPDTDIKGAILARWKSILYSPQSQSTSVTTEGAMVNSLHYITDAL